MSIIGLSMAVLPCRAEEDVEAGSAALRVDWPVYPRRAEHNTVVEGGNRRWAEIARQNAVPIALAEADQRTRPGLSGGRAGGCRKNAAPRDPDPRGERIAFPLGVLEPSLFQATHRPRNAPHPLEHQLCL